MRWLLRAYPRDYRRDELLDTLIEAGLPPRRVAANLIRHGLRARLGRAASRTVVVWAMLATVACGLFSAALATRAAWITSPPPPTPAEAAAVFAEVLPDAHLDPRIDPAPATWVVYGQPVSMASAHDLLFGDGGEYQQSAVGTGANGPGPSDIGPVVADLEQRMSTDGWRVYPIESDEFGDVTISARRADVIFEAWISPRSTYDTTYIAVGVRRATPAAVWPAGILAGLIGAALGWLVFGWASRRTEGRHPVRFPVVTLYGMAMFLWWAPIAIFLPTVAAYDFSTPQAQWDPFWKWLGQPDASLPFLVGAACVLLALALSALPRPRPTPEPTPTTG
jgi:hypothetical protein